MTPNWDEIRAQFPALEKNTYLFSAATMPLARPIYEEYRRHVDMLFETGDIDWKKSMDQLDETRALIAKLIDAHSSEDVGFVPNTSHAMNLFAMMIKEKTARGKVLIPSDEFPATSLPWFHHGFEVHQVPVQELAQNLSKDYIAVVTSSVQYALGYRIDLEGIGAKLAELRVPFFVNATQSLGAFPISVKKIQASGIAASCHKWFGAGYGTTVFYTSSQFRENRSWPLAGWLSAKDFYKMRNDHLEIRSETSAVETGVLPFTTLAGLNAAVKWVQKIGVENISQRILELSDYLYSQLKEVGEVLTPRDNETPLEKSINSGTLLLKVSDADTLVERLKERGVVVSARRGALRFAVHYFNNKNDIDRAVSEFKNLIR